MVILTLDVDPNVCLTQIVPDIRRVFNLNVEMYVLETVRPTPSAKPTITSQCAVVRKEWKEMHLLNADLFHV